MAAIPAEATFTFTDYLVGDGGITMHFVCLAPGPGNPNDYTILLTDAELAAVSTQQQLRTLVQSKLDRLIRAVGIAAKLDAFIGQALTV